MGLSTKNVTVPSGGGMSKTIKPGIHEVKIHKLELKQFPFMEKDDAYYLIMHVETKKPSEDFEGFFIDPADESLGRYEGQVGQVKTQRWYYADSKTKKGDPIDRDTEIMKFLKLLCIRSEAEEWFDKADGKFNDIEEMVAGINKSKVFKGKWYRMCVAGKEYPKKDSSYTGVDMYLPYNKNKKVNFELAEIKNSMLLEFDEKEMYIKHEDSAAVNSFKEDPSDDEFFETDTPEDFEL